MGAMAEAVTLLPAVRPGIATMLLQAGCGVAVYGIVLLALDTCRLRSLLIPRLRTMLDRRMLPTGTHT